MVEKARESRKKLIKDYANKIKNSNKDNNFPIRKAASNNIEHEPLKFIEQIHDEEKKQPDI